MFPRIVQWKQGSLIFTLDLLTGSRRIRMTDTPHYGRPADTFRVISVSDIQPKRNRVDLGEIDAVIDEHGLRFVRDDGAGVRQRRIPQRNTYGRVRAGAF